MGEDPCGFPNWCLAKNPLFSGARPSRSLCAEGPPWSGFAISAGFAEFGPGFVPESLAPGTAFPGTAGAHLHVDFDGVGRVRPPVFADAQAAAVPGD